MRALKAGVIYFVLVFAVGWVLGPIRELWAVPRFGRTTAVSFEPVIMLAAMGQCRLSSGVRSLQNAQNGPPARLPSLSNHLNFHVLCAMRRIG